MLVIEKGGEEQIGEELSAYNPLIPNGSNFVCVIMFQIENREKRKKVLYELGHIEKTFFLQFENEKVPASQHGNDEVERTTVDGKTSAVHFLTFSFTPSQVEKLKKSSSLTFGTDFPNYAHSTTLPPSLLSSLKEELF